MQPRSTNATNNPSLSNVFGDLAERLSHWRGNRRRGERIPEELWSAATALARHHGLAPTASALKLNYYDLQRRLGGKPSKPRARSAAPAFVELPALAPATARDTGTVELIRSNGSRLTLRLPTARVRELLPLVNAFLRS